VGIRQMLPRFGDFGFSALGAPNFVPVPPLSVMRQRHEKEGGAL